MSRFEIMEEILDYLKKSQFKKSFIMKFINQLDSNLNIPALSMAIFNRDIDIALILVHIGASSYFPNTDESKDLSPIFLAVEIEHASLIETMCDYG